MFSSLTSIHKSWLIIESEPAPRLVSVFARRGSEQFNEASHTLKIRFPAYGEIQCLADGNDFEIRTNVQTRTNWTVHPKTERVNASDITDALGQSGYVLGDNVLQAIAGIRTQGDTAERVEIVDTDPTSQKQLRIIDHKTIKVSRDLIGQRIEITQLPICYPEMVIPKPIKKSSSKLLRKKPPTLEQVEAMAREEMTQGLSLTVNLVGTLEDGGWGLLQLFSTNIRPDKQSGGDRVLTLKYNPDKVKLTPLVAANELN